MTRRSRFERLVKIASGGTATVYVARRRGCPGLEPLFALKRTHPHLRSDDEVRRLLVREARLASQIAHPKAVSIREVEEIDGELLLVMDYVPGGSLAELLAIGPRPPLPLVLRILLDACEGLAAVHAMTDGEGRHLGFVHRDVSPQNILVGIDGVARITDFGLAKLTEVSMSRTEVMRGKVAYMAPEYLAGGSYSQRCDLFAMAIVIWEALAMRRLFLGAHEVETIRRVTHEPAPLLSHEVPALSGELTAVVARGLAKDPLARPNSVDELAGVLCAAAVAPHAAVAVWVQDRMGERLGERQEALEAMVDGAPTDPGLLVGDGLNLAAEHFQLDEDAW